MSHGGSEKCYKIVAYYLMALFKSATFSQTTDQLYDYIIINKKISFCVSMCDTYAHLFIQLIRAVQIALTIIIYHGVIHKWHHGLRGEGVRDFVTTAQ